LLVKPPKRCSLPPISQLRHCSLLITSQNLLPICQPAHQPPTDYRSVGRPDATRSFLCSPIAHPTSLLKDLKARWSICSSDPMSGKTYVGGSLASFYLADFVRGSGHSRTNIPACFEKNGNDKASCYLLPGYVRKGHKNNNSYENDQSKQKLFRSQYYKPEDG
jgi:hypothetical protein